MVSVRLYGGEASPLGRGWEGLESVCAPVASQFHDAVSSMLLVVPAVFSLCSLLRCVLPAPGLCGLLAIVRLRTGAISDPPRPEGATGGSRSVPQGGSPLWFPLPGEGVC